jgi:hypothetical protein
MTHGEGGGSKIRQKSVTYYLNGPLLQIRARRRGWRVPSLTDAYALKFETFSGLPSDGSGDTFLWLGIGLGCLVGVICIGGVACKFVRPFFGGKRRKTGTSNTQVENQNHDCGDMVDSDFESY